MKKNFLSRKIIFLVMLFVYIPQNGRANTLKELVHSLQILPVQYGENHFRINGKNLSVIKGKLITGNAWEQETYIVLLQQKDIWQIIANDKNDVVMARAIPHTGEDSISSVYFMIPKNVESFDDIHDLYLLTVLRKYQVSPLEKVQAKFLLAKFESDELGMAYFQELKTFQSKNKYCNSDSASYHEFNIPLPYNGEEFPCLK